MKGVVTKGEGKGKADERPKGKGEDPEARKYVFHENDRMWKDVGRRCKLVCDCKTVVSTQCFVCFGI